MKIKKLLSVLCATVMVMSLASCGGADSSDGKAASAEQVDTSAYELYGDFSKEPDKKLWEASNGWSNGNMFNCTWRGKNAAFADGVLKLSIDTDGAEGKYSGAEYRTKEHYGYGLYEVSMKPIKNVGVVSSFFTYTGPSENNPWDEIDIEFLGKDTTKVQFNYFTNGKGNHEKIIDLGFDASEEFHTYGFRWEKDKITWYVDGNEVHTAEKDIPVTPSKLMMNVWNGKGVDSWLGKYDGKTPLTAEYQWARFKAE